MNRGGMYPGSTLIVLMFTVLCLSIFALLSLSAASADKALADVAVRMVKGYYEADTLAECILAEIPEAGANVRGINTYAVEDVVVMFSCPISDTKELYVEAEIIDGSYNIRKWQMQNANVWVADDAIPVWLGD